ncbi:hypothetical protein DB88DRAFT_534891 [Papiliotrema laurentii]|uniref:Nonselective cation channel n=1 Tax=Papiliotrema laurentii TaxID=5418 RepID=A0AAD9FRJ8_PAPLA|nr:hypothetical protein DB88DRAFT_534891 [Papiliotrema laurentii]
MSPTGSTVPLSTASTFLLIHELHRTILESIDTALTWEQLNAPSINYTLIRPIIDRLAPTEYKSEREPLLSPDARLNDTEESRYTGPAESKTCIGAILFALMANRLQFISLANSDLSYAPLQSTRAAFCELVAMKVLRKLPHPENDADLAGELVREFCAFEGAPQEVWASIGEERAEIEEIRNSALELAIVTTSKRFLSLPIVQRLIHGIYVGSLVYSPSSTRALITDTYISERTKKQRQPSHSSFHRPLSALAKSKSREKLADVYLYNPYEAGWLDHGRLRVPKYRRWQEFLSQAILLTLFITTLSFKDLNHLKWVEVVFIIFTAGFMLDEYATSQEHGWTVYTANAWNVFDLSYIAVFLMYLVLRCIALASHSTQTSDLAFDILACGACILFPRLVFFLIRDNVVILALKAMIARFIRFMGLVILAFSGICFCLWTLGRGTWTVRQITWLMLQIWFGSSYLGFSSSESFHPIFGPIILIAYAALCNTLLITILISILSNEFAEINANAQEEHLFQRVVKTVEGVKSDAIFSYLPPVNLIALLILGPLSWVLTPRTLHRVNVFAIRATSFPFLLSISAWERWQYRSRRQIRLGAFDHIQKPGVFSSFLGGGSETLISSVFEVAPSTLPQTDIPVKRQKQAEDGDEDRGYEGKAWQSPLAEIFGKTHARRQIDRPEDISTLRAELQELRQSQLRTEEILARAFGPAQTSDQA